MSVPTKEQIRERAENDLEFFAKLVGPQQAYGQVHEDLFQWLTRPEARDNLLVLMPRDHRKSHCIAILAAWLITREPWQTIMYVSATADLAEKQLYAIKEVLESEIYQRYWPEMICPEEGKRARWTVNEIIVDHPRRKAEQVRDPTIKAVGVGGSKTGFHCTTLMLDDLVVPENAYTEEGRRKVEAAYSQLASIKTTGSRTYCVGTRYHPRDIYDKMMTTEVDFYEEGELIRSEPLYEMFFKVVEKDGEFLWPKQQRTDGRWFGFDANELAKKKAEYFDKTQFFAQYYNNPNDPTNRKVNPDLFQYYDKAHLTNKGGDWVIWAEREQKKLNIYASIDFAFSLGKRADYTTIAVVGIDADRNIYVLDLARFKTDNIRTYSEEIKRLWMVWGFRKLRAEVTVAQAQIVKELRTVYFPQNGISVSIDTHNPSRHVGSKDERIDAVLLPKYEGMSIYHYRGGNCQLLEEEVMLANPPHDDLKDALACAIEVAVPPARRGNRFREDKKVVYHPRFGGVGL